MEVKLGAEIMGPDGSLGTIEGMIVNQRMDGVEDLIIRSGGFASSRERVLPLSYVTGMSEEGVRVNLNRATFEAMDPFTEEGYHARQLNYTAPPEAKDRYTVRGDFQTDVTALQGDAGYEHEKPGGYPGGEQTVPEDRQLPVIRLGEDVLDITGERLGDLGEFAVRVEDGRPVLIGLREGLIFKKSHGLPVGWIKELAADGVVLNVGRQEIEERERAA